ncbi:hypothetical protein HNE_0576 [Hyphomonas neptunium ATCC 15444]|uniref:Uncharacterized protein n=1 Tax=Hyphomonas neptunium (strain ATCC 15444) TaxID=228405 RepID=Q0C4N8_HYPNA|nr:hypothetical protein HNE_0576 [Hyphomonas neptunium ATCC 15444]
MERRHKGWRGADLERPASSGSVLVKEHLSEGAAGPVRASSARHA